MKAVETLVNDAIGRVFPGAAFAVVSDDEIIHTYATGHAQSEEATRPCTADTLFDVASLTKIVATTPVAMALHKSGRLPLDEPVAFVDGHPTGAGNGVTVRRLLAHTAGLPAWRPFYAETSHLVHLNRRRRDILRRARALRAAYEADEATVYSDVGFSILTHVIENVTRERLDTFCRREIFGPLGMHNTFFAAWDDETTHPEDRFAATEVSRYDGLLVGRVHDENARAMGGVAGHAGVFSTVHDLGRYALSLLSAYHGKPSTVFDPGTVQMFCQRYGAPAGSTRCLGFDSVSEKGSSTGTQFSARSVGHLGYTGCSLWVDLDAEIAVVLLTNRVHPSRANDEIRAFRPKFHDAVRGELGR